MQVIVSKGSVCKQSHSTLLPKHQLYEINAKNTETYQWGGRAGERRKEKSGDDHQVTGCGWLSETWARGLDIHKRTSLVTRPATLPAMQQRSYDCTTCPFMVPTWLVFVQKLYLQKKLCKISQNVQYSTSRFGFAVFLYQISTYRFTSHKNIRLSGISTRKLETDVCTIKKKNWKYIEQLSLYIFNKGLLRKKVFTMFGDVIAPRPDSASVFGF